MASGDVLCPSPSSESAQLDGEMGSYFIGDGLSENWQEPPMFDGENWEIAWFPVLIVPSTNPATNFYRGNASLRKVQFWSGLSPENIFFLADKHVLSFYIMPFTHWNKLG